MALVFVLSAACISCGKNPDIRGRDNAGLLNVLVTFDAIYEIASAVGGGRVSIEKIMPDGAEAHDFEPQAKDLAALSSADMLIVNGLGFDSWAEKAASASSNAELLYVDASAGVEPIGLSESEDDGRDSNEPGGEEGTLSSSNSHSSHIHGSYDPHIWLSPVCCAIMAENIRDAFCVCDPDGAEVYTSCCSEFTKSLNDLFAEYSVRFSGLEKRTIVTGHAVFAYLCRDFDLRQNSVEGVFAEGEPSAKALASLIGFCLDNGITTILTEHLASPLVAETLAAEAGAVVDEIYTMEGAEGGATLLERMSSNLDTIYRALSPVK